MLRAQVFVLAAMGVAAITTAFAANVGDQPLNDLPGGGYKVTIRDWAKPPGGVPWAAVTAVEVAPDGSIYVIHRCHDNSCAGRPEPPILRFDASGGLLKKDRDTHRCRSPNRYT